MGSARTRSCVRRAYPRPWSGAGRTASRRRVSTGSFGIRRDQGASRRWGRRLAARVVALTQGDPPGETTHWTAAALSKVAAISISSVQRIWRGHGLQPHRVRQFKLSTDPAFAAKLRDVVGLYVDPPAHAVVLSVDEKSQIQALARTQAPLPMKPGPADDAYPRLQAPRNDDPVCRSGRAGGQGDRPLHAAPRGIRSSSASSTRSSRRYRRARSSTRSWTTMPSTSTPRSAPGSSATRAGPYTSPRPQPRGSTPSRASSPSLQDVGSDAAYSDR